MKKVSKYVYESEMTAQGERIITSKLIEILKHITCNS